MSSPHSPASTLRFAMWLALVALAIASAYPALRILYKPSQIRAEQFPYRLPATGPFSPEELQSARETYLANIPSQTKPVDIPPAHIERVAEVSRKMRQIRLTNWNDRQRALLREAEDQLNVGRFLLAFSLALLACFIYLAWKNRSPTPRENTDTSNPTSPQQ